ncbi:hypothetical protein [Montanilutibacter psychrotolerans]|uniref:PepSY domain-containing protein n=1 Tax=Montanilutibacter psychrotolerans TaxID=1327343 RepID=A0A3M8SYQ7_9GAMM|nr:hypothetical protein [Lysobacter psychrotolerans]RNF86497.1 hypothetical protein EER27_03580 [Lysobacter psychrotolerans]
MRKLLIGICLGLVASVAGADGVENKWRLEFSGNAESAGRIVLALAPAQGDPIRATVDVPYGRAENDVARDVRDALQAQSGKRYSVEVDDGEDVLVKKHEGERDFVITIVENSVQGVRINIGAE